MTDVEISIRREDENGSGRYVAGLPGGPDAVMTYRRLDAATIAIDHTFVPPAYRGQDIARKLVERGIADARAEGKKIVPVCSYVAVQFRRHPEWADLRAG